MKYAFDAINQYAQPEMFSIYDAAPQVMKNL